MDGVAVNSPQMKGGLGAALSCVCSAPGNRSYRPNPIRIQLRFSYKSRVRMAVRGFEPLPHCSI